MDYKRILTIQDVSCVGQCSLTVALPILSACGVETAILPSAVLSTHTAGFTGFTFRDLTDDMPSINEHWQKENIKFKAIYTGYLGSEKQIGIVKNIFKTSLENGGTTFVDPAMADNGKLYPIFDMNYVKAMVELCSCADYVIPNITEACFLTDTEYRENYDQEYIYGLVEKLREKGCKNIILTGVSFNYGKTGIIVATDKIEYYEHKKLPNSCHGTGDIYASVFVGAMMKGNSPYKSAKIAGDFVVDCIKTTEKADNHWYGAVFEPLIYKLSKKLK